MSDRLLLPNIMAKQLVQIHFHLSHTNGQMLVVSLTPAKVKTFTFTGKTRTRVKTSQVGRSCLSLTLDSCLVSFLTDLIEK